MLLILSQLNKFGDRSNKFESYYGISLDGAQDGQKVRVAFRLNHQNRRSEEEQIRLVANILDNHAYPEVMRRVKNGSLNFDFRLYLVHLVMFQDTNRNEILLNEEVKFMLNVKYIDAKNFKEGEIVNFEEIDDVLGLYADPTNDPNAGHIMLAKFRERWYYACDLIYELKSCNELCKKAADMVDLANKNMKDMHWTLFLDNLLYICMLLTQAIYKLQYNKYFTLKQNHKKNIEYLTVWANNGNIDTRYSDLYAKIFELRRNLTNSNELSLEKVAKESKELFSVGINFVEHIKNMIASLSYFRTPHLGYVKLLTPPQKKEIQKFKLISFGGIAAENAADYDKTVQLRFQVNCKDEFLENSKALMVFDILDNYAYPEAMKLVENRILSSDFRLSNVHLVMYADQRKNEILLNDSVRSIANTKFKQGKKYQKGEPIFQGDIEDYLALFPSESNDQNAAHVILTKLNDMWYCAYDLIYDRRRVRTRFDMAKSFLKTANYCLQEGLWGPFVDTLYSSTELAIQSILLLHHNPRFSVSQTHIDTRKLFSNHASLGNIDLKFSNHYIRLEELRDKGRYLNGTHGKIFSIEKNDAHKILQLTTDLITYIEKLLVQVDFSKKPTQGEYILLGKTQI